MLDATPSNPFSLNIVLKPILDQNLQQLPVTRGTTSSSPGPFTAAAPPSVFPMAGGTSAPFSVVSPLNTKEAAFFPVAELLKPEFKVKVRLLASSLNTPGYREGFPPAAPTTTNVILEKTPGEMREEEFSLFLSSGSALRAIANYIQVRLEDTETMATPQGRPSELKLFMRVYFAFS